MKFRVIFSVDASISIEVDAENEEQAKEKAWEVAYAPCLCHQCSDEIETGDVMEILEVTEVGSKQ